MSLGNEIISLNYHSQHTVSKEQQKIEDGFNWSVARIEALCSGAGAVLGDNPLLSWATGEREFLILRLTLGDK